MSLVLHNEADIKENFLDTPISPLTPDSRLVPMMRDFKHTKSYFLDLNGNSISAEHINRGLIS